MPTKETAACAMLPKPPPGRASLASTCGSGTLGMPTDALRRDPAAAGHRGPAGDRARYAQRVFCSTRTFDGHYSHFCKQILWPVFHYQIPDNPKSKAYEDHSWKYYVNVNQAFADKIVKNWKRGTRSGCTTTTSLLVPEHGSQEDSGGEDRLLPPCRIPFVRGLPVSRRSQGAARTACWART